MRLAYLVQVTVQKDESDLVGEFPTVFRHSLPKCISHIGFADAVGSAFVQIGHWDMRDVVRGWGGNGARLFGIIAGVTGLFDSGDQCNTVEVAR